MLALALLLLAAPVLLLLALFIALADGWPVSYSGTRLGFRRKPFNMYKLRTLRRGANRLTGGELLNHTHALTIRGGQFLRDMRLDELPQLLNIVLGDMSFVGPRPERPEVYLTKCRTIAGYERRFAVRPGLIGISQLFTPHGTAKRYRTLIDNHAIRRGERGLFTWGVVAFTSWIVLQKSLRRVARQSWRLLYRRYFLGQRREQRSLSRVLPQGAVAYFSAAGAPHSASFRVLDMNEEALLVECTSEPSGTLGNELLLDIPVDRGGILPAHRGARCKAHVTHRRKLATGARFVVRYKPSTARSEYMIHQYFLRTSLVTPHGPWRERSWSLPARTAMDARQAESVSIG